MQERIEKRKRGHREDKEKEQKYGRKKQRDATERKREIPKCKKMFLKRMKEKVSKSYAASVHRHLC